MFKVKITSFMNLAPLGPVYDGFVYDEDPCLHCLASTLPSGVLYIRKLD